MKSEIVGPLNPVEHDPDFFESEPYPIPYFNNQKIRIGFIEAKYQPYLIKADEVLQNFLKLSVADRISHSQLVYNYYEETLKYGYSDSLDIKQKEDIWDLVYPSEIIILSDESEDFDLCVSCGCEWEEEHGLQLVFKNGETLVRASGHE